MKMPGKAAHVFLTLLKQGVEKVNRGRLFKNKHVA